MANKRIPNLKGKYFWIFEKQDEALSKLAFKRKVSQSFIIREIMEQYLTAK